MWWVSQKSRSEASSACVSGMSLSAVGCSWVELRRAPRRGPARDRSCARWRGSAPAAGAARPRRSRSAGRWACRRSPRRGASSAELASPSRKSPSARGRARSSATRGTPVGGRRGAVLSLSWACRVASCTVREGPRARPGEERSVPSASSSAISTHSLGGCSRFALGRARIAGISSARGRWRRAAAPRAARSRA